MRDVSLFVTWCKVVALGYQEEGLIVFVTGDAVMRSSETEEEV